MRHISTCGVLWAYGNTPHEPTGEKPSFLRFGLDCRTPTESAFLPPAQLQVADVDDYQQELIMSLSSAHKLAAKSIQAAQRKYETVRQEGKTYLIQN